MKKITQWLAVALFIGASWQAQAQGTTCATATPVTPGTYTAAALTGTGATNAGATAAAWYSFTPASTGTLNINSCSGGADTRLWISSGTCAAQVAVANNDDFAGCISVGTDEYASRIQNLILTGGTTYYFQWDNRWDATGFTWSFTYSPLPNNADANVASVTNQYTRRPLTQLTGGVPLGGTIQNLSGNTLTNVVLTARVYTVANQTTPIATFASPAVTLNVAGTQNVTCGTWNPPASVEDYVIVYTETQTQTDAVPANNVFTQEFSVDYNYYGRDGGFYVNGLGTTAGNIRQGSQFTVVANDQLTGVQYYIGTTNATQQYAIEVYQVTGGVMGAAPVYTSPTLTTTGVAGWNSYVFPAAVAVTPGEYAVVIYHSTTTGAANIALGYDDLIYTPLKQWIKITTGAWQHPEDLGFPIAYMVRPKFGSDPTNDIRFVSNTEPQGEYTAIHTRQALTGTALNFSAVGKNFGTATVNNVALTATVRNAANTVVYTATSATQNLTANQQATFTVPSFTVTAIDDYTISYVFAGAGTDQIPNNNSGATVFSRSVDYMARNLDITGSLGIGANAVAGTYDNGILGQTFTLTNADQVDSVFFILNAPPTGVPVRVDIYNTAAGVPTGAPIASTTSYTTTAANTTNGVALTLPIATGTLSLAPGTYFFGVIEQEGNITLATSTKIFTANTAFIKWDANPNGAATWSPVESFGATFSRSFVLDPVFKRCLTTNASIATTNATCTSANGTATATVTGGTGAFTYTWAASAATTGTRTGLTAGTYTLTVTDINACQTTVSAIVGTTTTTINTTASSTNTSCGSATGTATVSASNGAAPYTYAWTGGQTTATATGLSAGAFTVTVTDANGCTTAATTSVSNPSAPTANTTTSATTCAGSTNGSATAAIVSGGTAPFTFAWSNGGTGATITGLAAGTYTGTVTDAAQCSFSYSATVTSPAAVTASGTTTNASCFGSTTGAVNLTAGGGTGTLLYQWNNSATTEDISNLAAGTYTVTVRDVNSCTATATFTITEPTALSLGSVPTSANTTCNATCDGSISNVVITGGTAPYTYIWNNGATTANLTGLCAGDYFGTVTDANGCTFNTPTPITITSPAALGLGGFPNKTDVTCNGLCNGTITNLLVVGGTTPYAYAWSNGAFTADVTGLCAGTYTGTITDANGCTYTPPVGLAINEPAALAITATVVDATTFGGTDGSVTPAVTGGTGPYTVTGGGANLAAGTYTVNVTDANGCTGTADFVVSQPNGTTTIANVHNLTLAPNPTDANVTLTLDLNTAADVSVAVFSNNGQMVTQSILGNTQTLNHTINLDAMPSGMYMVRLTVGSEILTLPIVKN